MPTQFDDGSVEVQEDLIWGAVGLHKHVGCMCFVRSLSLIYVIFWLLWHNNASCWPGWGPSCFIWEVCCMIYSEISRIYCGGRGETSCVFVRACDIAFFINLPIFSCAAVHVCVILVMSPDTLFVKCFNSCIIMLSWCRITVDWSCEYTLVFWDGLYVLLFVRIELL